MSNRTAKINGSGISNFVDVKGLTRDRPWLLPSNRRLRHLQGISLRNLTLSRPSGQTPGKAIDDESLPTTFKTPTKLLAQREKRLEHSRSSSDLNTTPKSKGILNGAPKEESDSDAFERPKISKLKHRRRSTINWSNAPPLTRQKKLEDVAGERMADTWFSLHCPGIAEPVYISEVIAKAMNPSFRFFDLNAYGPFIIRQDEFIIKYWARSESMEQYNLIIELKVHLRSLQFVGKSLENFHHPLPQNCILFHLVDGIYTSFTDLPLDEPVLSIFVNHKSNQVVQPTSSFDALMRLSNLDDCIQDALSTREKLTIQINDLLKKYQPDLAKINSVSQADESVASTNRALLSIRKQLKTAQSRRVELQSSLRLRRNAISNGLLSQEKSKVHLQSARSEFASRACLHREVKSDLSGQIRRICEDLNQVYPVDPVPQKTLSFTVCGLPLPNATSPSTDPATTAAALGHVAHAVHLISLYLSTPLPYPITPYGSNSTIYDPISTSLHSSAARTFPLYQKGAVAYRFEYGVFLLNTDIDLLMSRQGIRVVDIRHTLPNLKYLLTVLTEGKGEMPGRKGGKFRVGLESPVSESEEGKPKVEELDGRLVVDFKRYGKGKEAVGRVRSPLGRENGTLTSKVR